MIKFLKLLSDIVDPNYWASKISKKTGLEEKARNSKFRKWEAGLTGWKHWLWQIGGGILFFIVFEYLINLFLKNLKLSSYNKLLILAKQNLYLLYIL